MKLTGAATANYHGVSFWSSFTRPGAADEITDDDRKQAEERMAMSKQ